MARWRRVPDILRRVVLAGAAVVVLGEVQAQDASDGAGPAQGATYPADPGALQWPDYGAPTPLPADADQDGIEPEVYRAAVRETAQSVDDTFEWADVSNGPAVHSAYSAVTNAGVLEASLRRAEYEAGLAGLESLGVE